MKDKKEKDGSVRAELETLSPSLLRLKEEPEALKVPAGYFEEMQDEVWQKIKPAPELSLPSRADKPSNTLVDWLLAPLQNLLQPRWAMAIATLLLLIAAAVWMIGPGSNGDVDSFELLSYEEMENYIQQNIDGFDLDLLLEYTQVEDMSSGLLPETDLFESGELDQYMDEIIDDLDISDLEELL